MWTTLLGRTRVGWPLRISTGTAHLTSRSATVVPRPYRFFWATETAPFNPRLPTPSEARRTKWSRRISMGTEVDLAVANSGSGTVSILLGNGNGTFRTQTTYAVGSGAKGIVAADFNNDGKMDLAVSNSGAG